ncbi:helix-turn-helix domain-containing protein [Streptomyces finlayi]|nr:helix-turn-helix transcriptional regulator [Streptomyces finlayi]
MAQALQAAADALLEGEYTQERLAELLKRADRVSEAVACYKAAAVMDARGRGDTWPQIGAAAFVSPATARSRWNAAEAERQLRRCVEQGHSAGGAAAAPRMPRSADRCAAAGEGGAGMRARAARMLSGVLSLLVRYSALSLKEVADRTGMSPSYLSRIVAGERVPAWSAVLALTAELGADPQDLRAMWEAAQGWAKPPRPGLETAVSNLAAALRGTYLAAGCPPYERVAEATAGVVPGAAVQDVLLGKAVPCWEITSALLTALHAHPGDFRGLWDDANYAFLLCVVPPADPGTFDLPPPLPPHDTGE